MTSMQKELTKSQVGCDDPAMRQVPATTPRRFRVGLRLVNWMEGFGIRLFPGLLDFLRSSGVEWEICYDKMSGGDLPREVIDRHWNGDGLIVYRYTRKEEAAWRGRGIKVVNLSTEFPAGTLPFARLTIDPAGLAELAVGHLASLGLRQLAYWHDPDRSYSAERWEAFRTAAAAHGCEAHELRVAACRYPVAQRAARVADQAWRGIVCLPRPCGLFAKDDIAATAALAGACKTGLRCPQELAVLGTNDDPIFCETVRPAISSIRYPGRQAGQAAAKLLQELMEGGRVDDGKIRVLMTPGPLVRRESTGMVEFGEPIVEKAMRIIHQEAGAGGLGISQLARRVGVSRELLRQKFHAVIGRGPKQELDLARLAVLENRLAVSNDTLEAIAAGIGFSGADDLSRFFKRMKGSSPGEFRRTFRASR